MTNSPSVSTQMMESAANSYLSGLPNRYFQEQIWIAWGNAALKMAQSGQQIGLQMCGDAHAVFAFIAEFVTFRGLNPLPFANYWMPCNAVSWPTNLGTATVQSDLEFSQRLLTDLYGMQIVDTVPPDTLVVVIDPQLMTADKKQSLAQGLKQSGQPALLITKDRQALPKELISLVLAGQVTALATDAISPAVLPMVRDAVLNQNNVQRLVIAGAGPRLLPAAVNFADLALMTLTQKQTSYVARREAISQLVAILADFADLGSSDQYDQAYTMHDMLCRYVASTFNFDTSEAPDGDNNRTMEFIVKGYKL